MDGLDSKVIQTCWTYLLEELDPFHTKLADELFVLGTISWEKKRHLHELPNRESQVRELLFILQENASLQDLLDALAKCNYDYVVCKLIATKQEMANESESHLPEPIAKISEKSEERKASKLSHELMCFLHRGEEEEYFRVRNILKHKYKEHWDIQYALQDSMLSYCIMKYQNIDFDGVRVSDSVLKKLDNYKDRCANPVSTTLWYLTRKSVFLSLRGDYDIAMDVMNDGLSKLDSLECSRATEFSFISQVYALHMMWESVIRNPFSNTPKIIGEVVTRMDYALQKGVEQAVQGENVKHRKFHLRLLYLRWAFQRLGMNISGEVKLKRNPTEEEVADAGGYLDQVDKYWDGIECRREMFYYMARAVFWKHKARLSSVDPAKAKYFADLAIEKAEEGSFKKQIQAINTHMQELEEILGNVRDVHDSDSDIEELICTKAPRTSYPHKTRKRKDVGTPAKSDSEDELQG